MELYLTIFLTFLKVGCVGFGGGYAIIPIIESEAVFHHWLTTKEFTDIIAVAAMAPGPVAANSATVIGFKLAGIIGAVVACTAITLPSLLVILLLGKLFLEFQEHRLVKAVFYGLRATIVATIVYAAIKFAVSNGIVGGSELVDIKSTLIMLVCFFLLIKNKVNPVYLILSAGLLGQFVF